MSITIRLSSGLNNTFDKNTLTIGSDPSCDVVIAPGSGVQPLHARLRKIGDRWLLESAGAWPCDMNDTSKATKQWVASGASVGIGSNESLILSIAVSPTQATPSLIDAKAEPTTSSLPGDKESFLDAAKAKAIEFGETAKKATLLTAKQAERTKLTQWDLPSAYAALGRYLYQQGGLPDELQNFAGQADAIEQEIQRIASDATNRPKAEGFVEQAKATALGVKDAAHTKMLQVKARNAYAELGKAAYEQQQKQIASLELTKPIREGLARLASLDADIALLSQAKPGKWITPKRLVVAGCIFASLYLVSLLTPQEKELSGDTANPISDADNGTATARKNTTSLQSNTIQTPPVAEADAPIAAIPTDLTSLRGVRVGPYFSKEELSAIAGRFIQNKVGPGWEMQRVIDLLGKPTTFSRTNGFVGQSEQQIHDFLSDQLIPPDTKERMKEEHVICTWSYAEDPGSSFLMLGFNNEGRLSNSETSIVLKLP